MAARIGTYVGVVLDLVNGGPVVMARIAAERVANLVRVLGSGKNVSGHRVVAGALSKLQTVLAAAAIVDVLDPDVMVRSSRVIDVVLELYDVRIRDRFRLVGLRGVRPVVDSTRVQNGSVGCSHEGEGGKGGPHSDDDDVGLPATQA